MFVSVIQGLSAIARWMSPAAIGLAIRAWTLVPPADSPKIVTLSRVAAELRDVPFDPLERRDLVEEAVVAGPAVGLLRDSAGCAR